jgi:hypothetical protein
MKFEEDIEEISPEKSELPIKSNAKIVLSYNSQNITWKHYPHLTAISRFASKSKTLKPKGRRSQKAESEIDETIKHFEQERQQNSSKIHISEGEPSRSERQKECKCRSTFKD